MSKTNITADNARGMGPGESTVVSGINRIQVKNILIPKLPSGDAKTLIPAAVTLINAHAAAIHIVTLNQTDLDLITRYMVGLKKNI